MDIIAFPRKEIPASVCNHRYGADATFVQDSDTAQINHLICEMIAFKRNFQLTDFINPYNAPTSGVADIAASGRVEYGIYFPTDRWKNPVTGNIEMIPDYTATTWTSAGAEYFDVEIGTSKVTRTPNHGQQMYDLSLGSLGWDMVSGTPGTNGGNELFGMIETLQTWMVDQTGVRASAFSYRNGRNEGAIMVMPFFLGGRNSDLLQSNLSQDAQTDFGIGLGNPDNIETSRVLRINQPNSSRFRDMYNTLGMGSKAAVLSYINSQVGETVLNNGMFNDFIHRYQYGATSSINDFDEFLETVNTAASGYFLHRAGYGEAIEYLFFREMIADVAAFEQEGEVKIVLRKSDKYKELVSSGISQSTLIELLRTPVSIEIDLSGTPLSGKTIKANLGTIVSKGTDIYVINIPYGPNHFENFGTVVLSEDTEANYLDLTIPSGSKSIIGTSLNITSSQPCQAVLFVAPAGGDIWEYWVLSRESELSGSHSFNISGYTSGYDFKVGIINEAKQSFLIE